MIFANYMVLERENVDEVNIELKQWRTTFERKGLRID